MKETTTKEICLTGFRSTDHNPKYIGKYCLGGGGGLCFLFRHKPNLIHRWFMRILLGWVWLDEETHSEDRREV